MQQKLKIKVKSYDAKLVEKVTAQIIDACLRSGAKVGGPIPLPTQRKVWVVPNSPNIDVTSKEHFELKIHKRLIEIYDHNSRTIDSLTHLQLAAGVSIEIK